MPTTGWISVAVAAVGLFVVIAVIAFTRRSGGTQRSKAGLKGFGLSVNAESSSDVTPGILVEDASSTHGGMNAADNTGRGIKMSRIQTKSDITLMNTSLGDPGPK